MSYDDANSVVRREIAVPNVTGVASTSVRKLLMFQRTRIKKVHALVVTAGTDAAAGFDILSGTSSVGQIVLGTDTAGSVDHSGVLDAIVDTNGYLDIKGKANSATLVASLVVECEVLHDAVRS